MFFLIEYLLKRVLDRIDSMEAKIVSALDDLTAAVAKLTAEEAQFLTDIAGRLSGGSVSDDQAEALATVISQRADDLTAADPGAPPSPPVVTPGG